MAQPNGPRPGKGTGRFRDTLVNAASKATPVPVVGPASAINLGQQQAVLANTLYTQLAGIKTQQGLVKGQFLQDKAAIRAQEVGDIAAAANAAAERGLTGSSIDFGAQAEASAAAAAARQQAIQQKVYGLLGLKQERLQAANAYYSGLFDIQAQRAAEQSQLSLEALLRDLVLRPDDETVPAEKGRVPAQPVMAPVSQGKVVPQAAPAVPGSPAEANQMTPQMKQVFTMLGNVLDFLPSSIRDNIFEQLRKRLTMGVV